MNLATVVPDMLNAAEAAAGNTWSIIQHDFVADLGGVTRNAARIEASLASEAIDEQTARTLLDAQKDTLAILALEVEEEAKVLVQNAINAAIDVLWTAIRTAARI